MMYVATVNVPGYLPMDDDPPVFETAEAAWAHLADERERDEDYWPGDFEYTETLGYLRFAATGGMYGETLADWPLNTDGTGTIYGPTPESDSKHDLGLAYSVSVYED